jgi:hypothetical protein
MPVGDSWLGFALATWLALAAPLTAGAAEPGFAWMVNQGESNATLVYGSTEIGEDYSLYPATTRRRRKPL